MDNAEPRKKKTDAATLRRERAAQKLRENLTRRKQQLEMADSLKEQCESQEGSLESLYDSMKQLEAKMAEAKAKKDQIIARARTAKAATKATARLGCGRDFSGTHEDLICHPGTPQ